MHAVFFGLPRSGKTSTKNRLIGKPAVHQQPSTGVAENVSRVEIEKTTIEVQSPYAWHVLDSLDDETAVIVEEIYECYESDKEPSVTISYPPAEKDSPHLQGSKSADSQLTKSPSLPPNQKSAKMPLLMQASNPAASSRDHLVKRLEVAVRNARRKLSNYKHPWTIYLTDAGGQPEFQELLPALVSGFSVFFIFLRLDQDLHMKCNVEYLDPRSGKSIIPIEATFTIKEALLQCLATVASTKKQSQNSIKPKVVFIGTHKDKVKSVSHIEHVDKELQEAVKSTSAYRDGIIEFAAEDHLLCAVNNLSSNTDDIKTVQRVVERIGRKCKYMIKTPHKWMLFSIILRQQEEKVLSFSECFEIAKACEINLKDEVRKALSFFHQAGIVRYYEELAELSDFVIIKPQYLFDKLTELIVDTFTFDTVDHNVLEDFKKKGIFPVDVVRKLSTDVDGLTKERFTILLEHLRVIAPIKKDGQVVKYFAPFALSHCEISDTSDSRTTIPPILFTFQSGYCPKGMFGYVAAELIRNKNQCAVMRNECGKFMWQFQEDKIYRNQICFRVGPYKDTFQISYSPSYIKIVCIPNDMSERNISIGSVCCHVRDKVQYIISDIASTVYSAQETVELLAFSCSLPEHSHAAIINLSSDYRPCTLSCPEMDACCQFPKMHLVWFDEVSYHQR